MNNHTLANSARSAAMPPFDQAPDADETKILQCVVYPRLLRNLDSFAALTADEALLNAVAAEIQQTIEDRDIKLLSFDVFDTALIRSPECEARRFYSISQAFAQSSGNRFSAMDAFIARSEAARSAYAYASTAADGTREGRFALIARLTCDLLLVPDMVDAYTQAEMNFEKNNLRVNPLVKKIIAANLHLKTVFISDMYLEAPHIEALLKQHYASVSVFSSADGNGSKRSGGLYGYVEKKKNTQLANMLHFGDSLEGDFRSPKKLGAHACYLPLPDGERRIREQSYALLQTELDAQGFNLKQIANFNY